MTLIGILILLLIAAAAGALGQTCPAIRRVDVWHRLSSALSALGSGFGSLVDWICPWCSPYGSKLRRFRVLGRRRFDDCTTIVGLLMRGSRRTY